jgi:hypothetical protein
MMAFTYANTYLRLHFLNLSADSLMLNPNDSKRFSFATILTLSYSEISSARYPKDLTMCSL